MDDDYTKQMLDEIIEIHKAEQTMWIPVSERLPEEDGHYIVTMKRIAPDDLGGNSIETRKMRLHDGEWRIPVHFPKWINDEIEEKVLAWMPLPDPYKAESEE